MPTYDYICTSCKHAWELEQRIVEDPVRKCPKCRANTAKRQISSGAGFILKGGGWYADGYGSKKTSSTEAASESNSSSTETKSESKSDTKADASGTSSDTKKSDSTDSSTKSTETKTEKKSRKSDKKASAA